MSAQSTATPDQNSSKQYCGCDQNNLHLHLEIENLKQRLLERERHIVKMETNFLKEAEKFPNGEFAALSEELSTWQDKYSRLFEAHRRVQKVNQGLEDKLLKMVDKCETEKNNLQEDLAVLTKKLIEQQNLITKLYEENERYRNDLNIAIQLLQCKPSNFIPQKFDVLPPELQAKVRSYIASKQRKFSDGFSNNPKSDMKVIKVPIPTFPPTAMVYSLNTDKDQQNTNDNSRVNVNCNSNSNSNNVADETNSNQNIPVDIVSAAIMAKVLKEREKERSNKKHCQTCSCAVILYDCKSCQTDENLSTDDNDTDHADSDNFNNNFRRGDELEKETAFTEYTNTDSTDSTIQQTSAVNSKKVSEDLIDLNGYNSDDNYEYFRNLHNKNTNTEDKNKNNKDLILFDTTVTSLMPSENIRGPRLCSVRLQPGSNNILLDNAAHFSSPILYRRRSNMSDTPESEPIVHLGKMRTSSVLVSSDYSENKLSTETEI